MLARIAIALLCLAALTGCSHKVEAKKFVPPKAVAKVRTTPADWPAAGPDTEGRRPDQVVSAYLEARKSGDLESAWELVVSDERPEFEVWRAEYAEDERVLSFEVGEARSGAPGTAAVQVSLESEVDGKRVTAEDEWWSCRQDQDGTWKVNLLPRRYEE